jgi:hypothetical protein
MGDSVRFATSYKMILVVGPTSASANTVTAGLCVGDKAGECDFMRE